MDFKNTEDLNLAFRIGTWLVAIGSLLNTLGYVLVMEGLGEAYAAAKTGFWQTMVSWRSSADPELAAIPFYACLSAPAIIAGVAFVMAIRLYSRSANGAQEDVRASAYRQSMHLLRHLYGRLPARGNLDADRKPKVR